MFDGSQGTCILFAGITETFNVLGTAKAQILSSD